MNESGAPKWKKPARLMWRFVRPLLIAYLLVVLAMVMLETWLVYPAPPMSVGNWSPTDFKYENVWFASADGTKLHGWFLSRSPSKRAILYCHGNGEDVASVGELAAELGERMDASVFVFDYRGYGRSEGRPYEAGCIADGNAAQHWLAERMQIPPNEVVLMGRSLGSAIAVALAAKNGAKALILQNAFPTMTDVAAWHYPWLPVRWLMANRYDNLARIGQYHGPLLQSHGTRDEVVPIAFGRRLFDAAPSKNKQWLELPGLGHNDPSPASYYAKLAKFLEPT